MERGRIRGLPKVFKYSLLSQEQVKLRTSNFVLTFIRSITTKAHYNNFGQSSLGRSHAGTPEIFQGIHI